MAFLSALAQRLMRRWNLPRFQSVFFTMESVHLARAYGVVAELGIADLVNERPRDIDELAQATGTDPKSLLRVLRTLAAFGVFAQDRQGRFGMTRRARVLLTDTPGSLRSWVRMMGQPEIWQGYAQSLAAVKTGIPPFEQAHGAHFYEYLATHPAAAEKFFAGLGSWTEWQSSEIVKAYDFGRFTTIMDVGGGAGSLLSHILLAHAKVQGILFDQGEAARLAEARFAAAELGERCRTVLGNFFDPLPRGADALIIKNSLCDWNDESAARLLCNFHAAMEPGATLLVIDAVVDERNNRGRITKLLDLDISSFLPGGMRTRAELTALVEGCGFGPLTIHQTAVADIQIIEAVRLAESAASMPSAAKLRTDQPRTAATAPVQAPAVAPAHH